MCIYFDSLSNFGVSAWSASFVICLSLTLHLWSLIEELVWPYVLVIFSFIWKSCFSANVLVHTLSLARLQPFHFAVLLLHLREVASPILFRLAAAHFAQVSHCHCHCVTVVHLPKIWVFFGNLQWWVVLGTKSDAVGVRVDHVPSFFRWQGSSFTFFFTKLNHLQRLMLVFEFVVLGLFIGSFLHLLVRISSLFCKIHLVCSWIWNNICVILRRMTHFFFIDFFITTLVLNIKVFLVVLLEALTLPLHNNTCTQNFLF